MRKKILFKKVFNDLDGKFIPDVTMKPYITMRIGGPARALYIPKQIKDLRELIHLCKRKRISLLPLGNGSNIIVPDKGTRKMFVKLAAPFFKKSVVCENSITCGAGLSLNSFCNIAEKNGLGGAEFLVGIPGSIGGAIACNAGAHRKEISDIIKDIRCIDTLGELITLKPQEASFKYRASNIKNLMVVAATFTLKRCKRATVQKRLGRYIKERLLTQDYTAPSAGCIFKNPKTIKISAGELIDRCGLKGFRIGGAVVSGKHANFIINKGKATAKDVLNLIQLVRKKVEIREGIVLEHEIEVIGW